MTLCVLLLPSADFLYKCNTLLINKYITFWISVQPLIKLMVKVVLFMNNQMDAKKRRKPKELNLQIGERCRQAREAAGYTQERLAEQIGVSTQFLSDAERGVTGMSVTTIIKLCNVLSVSADFLLLGRDGSDNTESALSLHSRIQRLSERERELVEEVTNLMIQSFHLSR